MWRARFLPLFNELSRKLFEERSLSLSLFVSLAYSHGKSQKLQEAEVNTEPNEKSRRSELSKTKGIKQRVRFEEDNCKVIVEVQSLENNRNVWETKDKVKAAQVKRIDPETQESLVKQKQLPDDTSHVVSTGSLHRDAERPISGQFESDLPPWKKQMLINRTRKDKEQERREREKVLIDNSKGAPFFWILFKNKQSIDNIVARHGGNYIFYSASDRPFYYVNTSSG